MMSVEEMIEKLTEFKSHTKKSSGFIEVLDTTEEVKEFIHDIPEQLRRNGFDNEVIEDIYEVAKFVPGNHVSKLEQLIEKLRSV